MANTYPANLHQFTSILAHDFYEEYLKEFMPKMFGDTKAELINYLYEPRTKKELENLTGKPYPTINSAMKDLLKRGVLGQTDYQYHKGYAYFVNFKSLLEHIATTDYGRVLISMRGVSAPVNQDWGVDRSNIYEKFPEPVGPVLDLKMGNERIDIFKAIVVSGNTNNKLSSLFFLATNLVQHVWYRSYLITAGGKTPAEVAHMSPTAAESRAAIRAISRQIKDYSKMLDTLTENELIWTENPGFESWRVIGDIPFQWAMDAAQRIVNVWDSGKVSSLGYNRTFNEDYEGLKDILSREIEKEWIEHQNALNKSQEESP